MFEQLKPNLFVFYGSGNGSNVFLLDGKKRVLVDASDEANAPLLAQALKAIGFQASDIDIVLFSHGHADHFSGAKQFKRAEFRMHKFDAGFVSKKDPAFTASGMLGAGFFPKMTGFLSPGETINAEPFELKVLHTPGHTQGSVSFFDSRQKLLFSGDLLFNGSVGRWDFPSGNKASLAKSIASLENIGFDLLLPGHNSILQENQLQNINSAIKMLSGTFI